MLPETNTPAYCYVRKKASQNWAQLVQRNIKVVIGMFVIFLNFGCLQKNLLSVTVREAALLSGKVRERNEIFQKDPGFAPQSG